MKATFDLPEDLLRRTKATAALQGRSLKEYVAEAVRLKVEADAAASQPPGWRSLFGRARREEVDEIDEIIAAELSSIDPETWR